MSSQYLTALLMAAPLATGEGGVEIRITDELVSQPYVDMTVRLMERFGVKVRHTARTRHSNCMLYPVLVQPGLWCATMSKATVAGVAGT